MKLLHNYMFFDAPRVHDITKEDGFKSYFDYLQRILGSQDRALSRLFVVVKENVHTDLRQTIAKLEGQLDQEINRRVKAEAEPKVRSWDFNRLEDEKRKRVAAESEVEKLKAVIATERKQNKESYENLYTKYNGIWTNYCARGDVIDELTAKLDRKRAKIKKLKKRLGQ